MEENVQSPSSSPSHMQYMQSVFSMCDSDGDGAISVDELKTIGLHIGWDEQKISDLVCAMDPDGVGTILFESFCKGVASFLLDTGDSDTLHLDVINGYHGDTNSIGSGDEVSSVGDTDSAFSTEAEVCPSLSSPSPQLLFNGYHDEYVANGESVNECDVIDNGQGLSLQSSGALSLHNSLLASKNNSLRKSLSFTLGHSSPRNRNSPRALRRNSSAVLLESMDDEHTEVSLEQLTEQLVSLSSERDQAFEEKEVTAAHSGKLKEENKKLMQRLLSFEDVLKDTSIDYDSNLLAAEQKHRDAVVKLTNEYELKLEELQAKLTSSQSQVQSLESRSYHLIDQLEQMDKHKQELEVQLAEKEELRIRCSKELQHQLEVVRRQSEEWAEEKESMGQELLDQHQKAQFLLSECDELRSKRLSIGTVDIAGEITTLNKEIDKLKEENADLRAQFLQHGRSLITQGQSIASELESASKDKIMEVLKETEETNQRLRQYIEGLLVAIIDRHPELLERK